MWFSNPVYISHWYRQIQGCHEQFEFFVEALQSIDNSKPSGNMETWLPSSETRGSIKNRTKKNEKEKERMSENNKSSH